MKGKTEALLIIATIGLVIILAIGIGSGLNQIDKKTQALYRQASKQPSAIPTIQELQIMVGAEPDSIVGPNTIRLWNKAICEQEAAKWDFMYEGE